MVYVPLGVLPQNPIEYKSPPYIPFSAFLMALDSLALGIPQQVNASLWPSFDRTLSGRVVSTFEFLNLIDNKGVPRPRLLDLTYPDRRKETLKAVLIESYRGLNQIDLSTASITEVEQILWGGRITGETYRKAVRFLLQAAKFAGLPLSTALRKGTRYHQLRRDRLTPRKADEIRRNGTESKLRMRGTKRMVGLRSGGEVSLVVKFDPSRVSSEDRQFLRRIIDEVSAYDQETSRRRKEEQIKEERYKEEHVNDDLPF